jgi:thiosulfate/3-mercaptopyruvate sulfurtransferase
MNSLIDAVELRDRRGEVKLFDLRWALTDPNQGRSQYLIGHIPGAVFVDLETDLSAPHGGGRHPLPDPATFGHTLGGLGLTPDDEVVVYDDMAGAVAARMWWMLRSIGHNRARLLDGGVKSWTLAGYELEAGDVQPANTEYGPIGGFAGVVTHQDLDDRQIVDVRAQERYNGSIEPVDPKAGHIPGALNIPLTSNLDEQRRFLESTRLKTLFADLDDDPVLSCGSGVNACHSALAMTLSGRPMPDIYIGSFSDWSQRDLPVVVGETP